MMNARTNILFSFVCVFVAATAVLYLRNDESSRATAVVLVPEMKDAEASAPVAPDTSSQESFAPTNASKSRYEVIAQDNIRDAFATLERETSGSQSAVLRKSLAQAIVNGNFGKLGEVIACLPPGSEREFLLSVVVPRAIMADMDGALKIIDELGTTVRGNALRHAISGLLESQNFEKAFTVLDRMPFSEHRNRAVEDVASATIGKDAAAFATLLGSLLPDEVPGVMQSAALTLRSRKDSAGLQQLLPMLSDNNEMQRLIRSIVIRSIIVTALERGDRASLPAFLAELPAHDRDLAQGILIVEDEGTSFREGVSAALDFRNAEAADTTIAGLVRRRLSEDPVKAAEEVLQLPDRATEIAIGTLVHAWERIDRGQLSDWIDGLPAGARRDKALEYYVLSVGRSDRSAAVKAASSVSDPTLREHLLRSLSGTP